MSFIDWRRARRFALIVMFVVHEILFVFFASGYVQRGTTVGQLSATLARRSPTTVYTNANNEATDCRAGYEDRQSSHQSGFLEHVADALLIDPANPDPVVAQRIGANLARDQALLTVDADRLLHIADLCPAPTPPVYDEKGQLLADPVVPDLHPVPADPPPTSGG